MNKIISDTEYDIRFKKIQNLLKKSNIEALLFTLGKNFQYLLGSKAPVSERLVLGLITSQDNKPHLISPSFEVTNLQKTTPVEIENIHPWEDTDNPYLLLKTIVSEFGLDESTIALSPQTPFTQFKKMEDQLTKAKLIDGYSLFRTARIVKTEAEISCLQKANKVTGLGIESAFSQMKAGMTEIELANIVIKELTERSGEPVQFAAVQFGENSADPHGQPTDRKLKQNEAVLIDAGTSIEGYNGDITNTTFFGKPTKKFLEIYDIVEEAQQRSFDSVASGALPEDVDEAARSYITEKGYGEFFTHRTGHGIGLDVHEDPYIVGGNKEPLLQNSAHSVEPGIYLLGKFGVRIEDIVIVGDNKSERATQVVRRYWEK